MTNAMKNAVVFSGRNGLDFYGLRESVVRIPEVSSRIREAQAILDSMELSKVDLFGAILSDDEAFFRNIKLKSLVSGVVQVGLFDRFRKTQRLPSFMVGNSNGDSALLVCTGQMSFREMIESSQALATLVPAAEKVVSLVAEPAPLLSGLSLTEYVAFRAEKDETGETRYTQVCESAMDLKKVVATLAQAEDLGQFINVGPAPALRTSDYRMLGSEEVEVIDSIELDPMLGWFWRGLRNQITAIAQ